MLHQSLGSGISSVGGTTLIHPSPQELIALNSVLAGTPIGPDEKVVAFFRYVGQLYYSAKYERVRQRNSFTINYQATDGTVQYGQVQYYVFRPPAVLAVVKTASQTGLIHQECLTEVNYLDKIIIPIVFSGLTTVIPAQNILSKLVCANVSMSESYVVISPNINLHD